MCIYIYDSQFNLGMIRIHGSCPAESGLLLVKEKLETFRISIDKDVVCTVSDGASVMEKFGKLYPVLHQLCYSSCCSKRFLS